MNWIWICIIMSDLTYYDQIHLTTLSYTNEIKSEGQIQCLNLHGLKDNIYKAFYGVHLWICEYVGVKMKHTQLPEKSREIVVVVHTQLSGQTVSLHRFSFHSCFCKRREIAGFVVLWKTGVWASFCMNTWVCGGNYRAKTLTNQASHPHLSQLNRLYISLTF